MFTVYLVPTENKACEIFPLAVSFNLTLKQQVFTRSLTATIRNYNYYNTTYVEFDASDPTLYIGGKSLSDLNNEVFAMLHMFTYAEISYVELMTFKDIKSDLSNCFQNLAVKIGTTNVQITIVPSQVCKLQIVDDVINPSSYIDEVVLNLDKQSFTFDQTQHSQLISDYQTHSDSTFTFVDAAKVLLLRQLTQVKGTLQLNSLQGTLEIELMYDLNTVTIETTPNYFIYNFGEYSNNSITIVVVQNPVIATTFMQTLQFNRFVLRFYGTTTSNTHFEVQKILTYSADLNLWKIPCSSQECVKFITESASGNADMGLDFVFFQDENFVDIQKTAIIYRQNCLSKVSFTVFDNQLCANLYRLKNLDTCKSFFDKPITVSLSVIADELYTFTYVKQTLTNTELTKCFPLETPIPVQKDKFQFIAFNLYDATGGQSMSITQKYLTGDQKQQSTAAIAVGAAVGALCLAVTIFDMVLTVKTLKKLKKQQKAPKPQQH